MFKYLAVASVAAGLMCSLPRSQAEAAAAGAKPAISHASPVEQARVVVRRSGPRVRYGYYAAPVVVGPSCGYLRERAQDTGSRYWWRRYRECRGW
jgi:hypothetical protein